MSIDYTYLRQRYLNDISNLRSENRKDERLSGEDKRIEQHVVLLKDAVVLVKECKSKDEEEKNLRKWILTEFEKLLADLKAAFNNKNNKLIDAIWNEHGVAVWKCKKETDYLCLRVEGVNIVF